MLILFTCLALRLARAHEALRPTHPNQLLVGTEIDEGVHLTEARVVAFNRPLLEKRFPALRDYSDRSVELWILDRFAYVNRRQLELTHIRNTKIPHNPLNRIPFYIAPGAGRGADVFVDGQIVNLKGTGNSVWNEGQTAGLVRLAGVGLGHLVRSWDYSSGLEVFYQTTAEYLRHFNLQWSFDLDAALGARNDEAVDALFLIDKGYDVIAADEHLRAFLIGRDGHFGRATVALDPSRPEVYADHGYHQTTYSGARINFGGARAPREKRSSFSSRAKRLKPDRMAAFVRRELKILESLAAPDRERVDADINLEKTLNGPSSRREVLVNPLVLAPSNQPRKLNLNGDSPEMARLKIHLFGLSPDSLIKVLSGLDDAPLVLLFGSSRTKLKIPLPEMAYLYGLSRGENVRLSALRASRPVLRRFPLLRRWVIDEVRAEARKVSSAPVPDFVRQFILGEDDFDEFLAHVFELESAPNEGARKLAHMRIDALFQPHAGPARPMKLARLRWPACDSLLSAWREDASEASSNF